MKRLFLFAAVTAVALSSCSKDEVTASAADSQKAISFSTYSAVATKAYDETKISNLASYTVEVVYTDGYSVFAEGVGVTNDTSTGAGELTSGTLYWPVDTDATLEFFAYSGVTYTSISEDGADIAITAHDGEADPVAAYVKEQSSTTATADGAVSLTFKHLLSLIDTKITANTTDTSIDLVITDVTYTSVKAGTATVDNTNAVDWTVEGDDLTSTVITSTDEVSIEGASSDDSTAATITVIPQTISVLIKGYWKQGDVVIDDFSEDGKEVTGLTVAANTSYTFTFSIAPDVTEISFTATVGDWATDTEDYTSDIDPDDEV